MTYAYNITAEKHKALVSLAYIVHIDKIALMTSQKSGIIKLIFYITQTLVYGIIRTVTSVKNTFGIYAFNKNYIVIRYSYNTAASLYGIRIYAVIDYNSVHNTAKLCIAVRLHKIA